MVCLLQRGHNNIIPRTHRSTHEKKEYLRGREAEDIKLFYQDIFQDSVT